MHRIVLICIAAVLGGCVTAPPRATGNVCDIFYEKSGWFDAADAAFDRWGAPIHVQMAIIYQESRFVGDARPPRKRLLWFIPWTHITSAYGYTQALDSTWDWYKRDSGNGWADRDDFDDATDFVGWYMAKSHAMLGISKWDAYSQYLAYHEGQTGYKRGSYRRKPWLRRTAGKVNARADRYARQLQGCRVDLEHPSPWWWPF
ncbi:lipoprotein [Salinisphaera sp. T5B8]|uniref:transglycosylase SLT domain-containing protein n=1 Tax=Salinisphaera sp. T5B8 TaxID=1304154 RepID=UPI00333F0546